MGYEKLLSLDSFVSTKINLILFHFARNFQIYCCLHLLYKLVFALSSIYLREVKNPCSLKHVPMNVYRTWIYHSIRPEATQVAFHW